MYITKNMFYILFSDLFRRNILFTHVLITNTTPRDWKVFISHDWQFVIIIP